MLPDKSVDATIADIPYGTTACQWDTVIPFEPMWRELKRINKDRAAIVLFGSQPFTSILVCSNLPMFRYEWIWDKKLATNFLDANKKPLKRHESITVFSHNGHTYNPQKETRGNKRWKGGTKAFATGETVYHGHTKTRSFNNEYYPTSIVGMTNASRNKQHPTQKPVALMEYLIRTYTNEGDTVLDFTCGSGTTLVACVRTQRNGIGFDNHAPYVAIAEKRVREAQMQLALPLMTP